MQSAKLLALSGAIVLSGISFSPVYANNVKTEVSSSNSITMKEAEKVASNPPPRPSGQQNTFRYLSECCRGIPWK